METKGSAIARLHECYRTRGMSELAADRPIAAITSNSVPWELLVAAGIQPLLLSPRGRPTPLGDKYMEYVFPARIRALFDDLLAGRMGFVERLIIPRTSEHEHKLFLYLREVQRQQPDLKLPDVHLYNLLQSGTPEAHAYNRARTHELAETLSVRDDADLKRAIQQSNAARESVRALLQVRSTGIPGAQVLPLIGAFYFMDRGLYAELAREAAQELAARPTVHSPRVLIKGAMLDQTDLHGLIESHGMIVAAEDDWWGSRAAEVHVRDDGDLIDAISDGYERGAETPRAFHPRTADEWFRSAAADVDAVIFFLPPADDVYGWDYPRQRDYLDKLSIPNLLIRDDVLGCAPSTRLQDELETFGASLGRS